MFVFSFLFHLVKGFLQLQICFENDDAICVCVCVRVQVRVCYSTNIYYLLGIRLLNGLSHMLHSFWVHEHEGALQ